MELIKGKWYKIEKGLGYIKYFKYLETDVFKKCWYSCSIKKETTIPVPDAKFSNTKDWLDISWEMKEVHLFEIQQYLPNGHPDKEFVLPEKWRVKDCKEVSKWASEVFRCGYLVNSSAYLCVDKKKFPNFNSYFFYDEDSACNYTEITFEQFKKYVLKTKEMEEKPIYVKVVDFGKGYSTHSDAREYGMTNYFYWTPGSPRLNDATKYRVVKNVLVNNSDESYILLDESTGYEYSIQIKGCKIIDSMEEKDIIGYKLKEDCKQFREAALKIMNANWGEPKYHVTASWCIRDLRKAGVLDLWFEPIFEEKFKIGDAIIVLNPNDTGACGLETNRLYYIIKIANDGQYENSEYCSCSNTLNGSRVNQGDIKLSGIRLATPEEIEKTLVEEAIKRGFKEGVKTKKHFPEYSDTYINCISTMNHSEANYESKKDALRMGGGIIYHKGKWAEILPSYPQIEINGYKGEFFDWGVKLGCAEIDKDVFVRLGQLGQGLSRCNRALESVTIGKGTFSKDQIKLISDYYLNKK